MAIKIGDRVAYSSAWLRSVGIYSGILPFARGTVESLKVLSPRCIIATIDWGVADQEEVPPRVNTANLTRLKNI